MFDLLRGESRLMKVLHAPMTDEHFLYRGTLISRWTRLSPRMPLLALVDSVAVCEI